MLPLTSFIDTAEIDASFLRLTMASETSLLDWYCKPETNVAWISIAASAFDAYTPCATETLVVSLSYFVLWCLICYRIYLIQHSQHLF